MRVSQGDRVIADAPATAEPGDDLVWRDYYTRTPQIRLSCAPPDQPTHPETATEITLELKKCCRNWSSGTKAMSD